MGVFVQIPMRHALSDSSEVSSYKTHSEDIFQSRLQQITKLFLCNQFKKRRSRRVASNIVEKFHEFLVMGVLCNSGSKKRCISLAMRR